MTHRATLLAAAAGVLLAACAGPTADMRREAEARMAMGVTYLQQRNLPAAMRELSRASELDPDNPEIDMVLGLAYRARGDSAKAEEHFRRAIRKKPDYADAHNNLGVLLSDLGRGDEALREFETAASNVLYRTPEVAYYNMGEEYRRRKNPGSAEAMYRRALLLNERYGPAYRGLALALSDLGRAGEAVAVLEKCVRTIPGFAPAWIDLGDAYARAGKRSEALDAYRSAGTASDDAEMRRLSGERIRALDAGAR